MLHMVVVTHGPDTCPIGNPEAMVKVMAAIGRMGEAAGKLGITVQGVGPICQLTHSGSSLMPPMATW